MIRLKLTEDERAAVRALRRERGLAPAERDRVEMVLLSTAGWTVPQIVEHLKCHPQTVWRLFVRYGESGVAAMRRHQPGPEPDRARRVT